MKIKIKKIKVPQLSESTSNAIILKWHKKEGDYVNKEENLVDIETDKIVLEIKTKNNGFIKKIKKNINEIVKTNETLCILEIKKINEDNKNNIKSNIKENIKENIEEEINSINNIDNISIINNKNNKNYKKNKKDKNNKILMPSAKSLIINNNKINLNKINGTGKDKRIRKIDILKFIKKNKKKILNKEINKMSKIRIEISKNLLKSKLKTVSLTTFNEVNMNKIIKIKKKYKNIFYEKYKVNLGFMSFFVKAVTNSLIKFPIINSSIKKKKIINYKYYNIGIAINTNNGLIVPILHNTNLMSIYKIEKKIDNFIYKANNNKLSLKNLKNGTFTITNGGIFGSILSTPIINYPQSSILGIHSIQKKPIVKNNKIVIRPMTYLALSYDHRLIDGKDAILFLKSVKDLLENPIKLFLEI
ncbi:putative 2-oxoglutarate dehydrogenase, E2 subunit [Candidatus Zinderia insecticola CARI]|uniref:Dihydrolipoyllysine-residue succinyltransferase n=1 Tax=Zinderia insecticola (strain CARI) TaxID=871271 RepID=E0TIZ2_ZINIC|nr:putative 2-oxoglutarate dehydrogenase, E2 subunit [Candidatus Zinderia insecticola CARI]